VSWVTRLNDSNFSNLGALYLGPDHFLRVQPFTYLLVLAAGAIWIAAVAGLAFRAWRANRTWLAGFMFFLGTGAFVTLAFPPTTDEPHYLMITESLLHDGDIEVADEYGRGAQAAFYPAATIDPHTVVLPDGRMYSQHTVGLPLLVLPGYAMAGRWGVLLILAAIAACLPGLLIRVATDADADAASARAAALLVSATAPALFASTLVFTEMTAAVLLAQGLIASGSGWIAPLCAAALPWLHPRYALLAAGVFVLDLARSRSRLATMGRWTSMALGSGGLLLSVYHGPALTAVLNVLAERYPAPIESLTTGGLLGNVSALNVPIAFIGKFMDRDFGLLPYAPWMLVAIPGFMLANRHGRGALLLAMPYFVVTCLFRNWGGSAFPGRTLVPLLPCAAPVLASGLAWTRRAPWRRGGLLLLVIVSLGQTWLLTACPVLRYTSGRTWLEMRAATMARVLPFHWWPSLDGGTGSTAVRE